MDEMLKNGFMINGSYIPFLCKLPQKTRYEVLGNAFDLCYSINSKPKLKDESGVLTALVVAITETARKFDKYREEKREKEALRKAMSRGQTRTDADKNGQTRTKADGRGQTRTDADGRGVPICHAESVFVRAKKERHERQERKKERVTPISPSEEGELVETADDFLSALKLAAETMHNNHPRRAGDLGMVVRALQKICKKNAARLNLIANMHAKWCASGVWEKDGGKWTPRLDKWILEGTWQDLPMEFTPGRSEDDDKEDGENSPASMEVSDGCLPSEII